MKKVFVITGGARGIGYGLVEHFRGLGHLVSTCDVWDEWVMTSHPDIYCSRCDVSREEEVQRFVQETVERWGRIDCLINNAAIATPFMGYDRFESMDISQFQHYLQVNLVGPALMMKYCVPFLRTSNGCIINIGSTRALMSEPNCEGYAASKGGLHALTHAAAMSLQDEGGIRVNCVAPGWIYAPPNIHHQQFPQQSSMLSNSNSTTIAGTTANSPSPQDHTFHPVGRVGQVHDIASICDFLSCSSRAGFITGQTFTVDGGVTRKMIYPPE